MTELVQAIFRGLFGLLLLAAVTWLSYLGKVSDQLTGAIFGVAGTYAFHLSVQAAAGTKDAVNGLLRRNGPDKKPGQTP